MRQLRLCLLLLTGLSSPAAGPVGLLLASLPLMFPVRSPVAMAALRPCHAALGAYRWGDGRDHALYQDYASMRGWCEMANKTRVA